MIWQILYIIKKSKKDWDFIYQRKLVSTCTWPTLDEKTQDAKIFNRKC